MSILIALLALLAPNASTSAATNCANAMTQTQINLCTGAEAAVEQKELDALLLKLKKSLSSKNWKLLEQSQTAWKRSRKLDCQIEASFFEGGSIQPTIVNACYGQHTHNRIEHIRYYLCPAYAMTNKCKAAANYD